MRKYTWIRASLVILLSLTGLPSLAVAEEPVDKITIKDGSILKGDIKRVENDELVLDTDFADDVVIEVEYIVDIESTQKFSIRLLSGEIISGFVAISDGKIVLHETLPTSGEPEALETPEEFDIAEDELDKTDIVEDELKEVDIAEGELEEVDLAEGEPEEIDIAEDELEAIGLAEGELDEIDLAESEPEEIDIADGEGEVPLTSSEPGPGAVVQQATPTAEVQPEPSLPDGLPGEETKVEIADPADDEASESQTVVTRPGAREFGFDDIDWIRDQPTYLRYDAELNVGVQMANGNTDTTDIHLDARFEPSFGWNTLRLTGLYDKKTADNETTTNRWKTSLVYERDFLRRWYVSAANSYEFDAQRELDLRIIFAAGVGYRFFDNDPTHFSVLPAIAYVIENFADDSSDTNYAALQFSTDFSRDLYKDDITFFNKIMYLNSLKEFSDITVETRTGIAFDVAWDLVLSAEFESDWENEPAEDAKKLDTRFMLKIGFEFEGDENDWFH